MGTNTKKPKRWSILNAGRGKWTLVIDFNSLFHSDPEGLYLLGSGWHAVKTGQSFTQTYFIR